MRVPTTCQIPAEVDCETGRPASALRVGHAALAGAMHVAGHMLGGPRIFQEISYRADGTLRYMVWRHPNCDYLYGEIWTKVNAAESASVVVTAGNGDPVTWTPYGVGEELVTWRVPWHAADSGWCEVTIVPSDTEIGMVMFADWPRSELGAGDHRCTTDDDTYPRIGLREGMPIAEADDGSVKGVLDLINDCWDDQRQPAVTWCNPDGVVISAKSADNPFGNGGDLYWVHQARQREAGDTTREIKAFVYAARSGSAEYSLILSTATDSHELSGLTNGSAAWQTVSAVDCACGSEDKLKFSGYVDQDYVTVYAITIGEV